MSRAISSVRLFGDGGDVYSGARNVAMLVATPRTGPTPVLQALRN